MKDSSQDDHYLPGPVLLPRWCQSPWKRLGGARGLRAGVVRGGGVLLLGCGCHLVVNFR